MIDQVLLVDKEYHSVTLGSDGISYRGLGLFLTAFWPYLRHLNPSSMISTSLRVWMANRGSLTLFGPFCLGLFILLTPHIHTIDL
jgi:hypothetical protein